MEFIGKTKRTGYFGSAVLNGHPDRTSKNAIHEFLHNLDAMLEMCGEERLSHPDQMSRNMETLLAEVPGGFEHLGLTDGDVRALVEAELRDELHYPWPAQLVYYQQAIERVGRENYGALLKHFGERTTRKPRTQLYENYIVPQGVEAYQVAYTAAGGLTKLEHFLLKNCTIAGHKLEVCWNRDRRGRQMDGYRVYLRWQDCFQSTAACALGGGNLILG